MKVGYESTLQTPLQSPTHNTERYIHRITQKSIDKILLDLYFLLVMLLTQTEIPTFLMRLLNMFYVLKV